MINRLSGAIFGALCALSMAVSPASAAENRSLDLYNTHTKERLTITFKKNGRYIPSALTELNQFLRDWRRNESIRMDPKLFDTVWELYKKSGSRQPIHVVSGYRSLATNDSLRSRSSGVAKHSQHTQGKAMDMFLPDVSVNRLREIGISMQRGGVGWYPSANSPFVHIDVGSVRAWPRMTRNQLAKIFPDGKTVHLPADGKPLAGYQQALAEMKKGGVVKAEFAEEASGSTKKGGLLGMLFGEEEDAGAEVGAAEAPAPAAAKPQKKAPVTEAPVVVAAVKPKSVPKISDLPGMENTAENPVEIVVAEAPPAPKPRVKPAIPVSDIPEEPVVVASAEPVILPRSKPALVTEPVVLAALPVPAPVAAPAAPEPVNAQMALAEVAQDRLTTTDSTTAMGYASATAPAAAAKPLIHTASLSGEMPITRSLGGNRADSLTALPVVKEIDSDPLASMKSAPLANNLPVFDAAQSTYWGVYATLVHPDQRSMNALLSHPAKMVVSSFSDKPYDGQMTSVRFTGVALTRLQVLRFDPNKDLALR